MPDKENAKRERKLVDISMLRNLTPTGAPLPEKPVDERTKKTRELLLQMKARNEAFKLPVKDVKEFESVLGFMGRTGRGMQPRLRVTTEPRLGGETHQAALAKISHDGFVLIQVVAGRAPKTTEK